MLGVCDGDAVVVDVSVVLGVVVPVMETDVDEVGEGVSGIQSEPDGSG